MTTLRQAASSRSRSRLTSPGNAASLDRQHDLRRGWVHGFVRNATPVNGLSGLAPPFEQRPHFPWAKSVLQQLGPNCPNASVILRTSRPSIAKRCLLPAASNGPRQIADHRALCIDLKHV